MSGKAGQGHFAFSKDVVLKASLVLTDTSDIRFKVTNFNARNMQVIEQRWDIISSALQRATILLASFGFGERNLRATTVLIPLAYYLRDKPENYATAKPFEKDRRSVRHWLIRSLVKSGVWGSGLDTLLTSLRAAIKTDKTGSFPTHAIETVMARLGKSLRFDEDDIRDLADTPYGDKNVFPILSLLYPGINVQGEFHEDHIFPRKLFTTARLRSAGVAEDMIPEFQDRVNGLPNLQILEGPVNLQKTGNLPLDWAEERYPEEGARAMYLSSHDMHDLPREITDMREFYDARRARIFNRLVSLLGSSPGQ